MGIYKIRTEFGHHLKLLMGVLAFIFVVGGVFMFGSMPKMQGGGAGSSDVIATVNGMEITRGEMESAWEKTLENVRSQPGMRSTLQLARVRGQVLQGLIGSRIAAVTADKMGVNISDKEVAAKKDEMVLQALRDNRRQVLGKISADEEKLDPRNDDEYKKELAKSTSASGVAMTIAQVEQNVQQFISDAQIRQGMAMEGIQKALRSKAGAVTPQEIANSFNEYKFRVIQFNKNLPQAQLTTQVNKVAEEAKKGTDFATLAKQYSQEKGKGAVQTGQYGMVSPGVWNTLSTMKAGQVSNPIDAGNAVVIVKVEDVAQKLPAKFDKKAQDDRRTMLENGRMGDEYMKFQQQLKKDLNVKVTDPEMNGYYLVSQARDAGSSAEAASQLSLAQKAFEDAMIKQPNNSYAQAMLADVLRSEGKTDKAIQVLYQLLKNNGYGVDLNIGLGDLLVAKGKKEDAAAQYSKASAVAGMDVQAHKALAARFKSVGKPDLAAKEQAMAADYEAKQKIIEAQQAKSAPKPVK